MRTAEQPTVFPCHQRCGAKRIVPVTVTALPLQQPAIVILIQYKTFAPLLPGIPERLHTVLMTAECIAAAGHDAKQAAVFIGDRQRHPPGRPQRGPGLIICALRGHTLINRRRVIVAPGRLCRVCCANHGGGGNNLQAIAVTGVFLIHQLISHLTWFKCAASHLG